MNVVFGSLRMQSHHLPPSPSSSLFFALLLVSCLIITTLSSSSAQEQVRKVDCSPVPYECGNVKLNISYPFWTNGRPMSCAYSEAAANFRITCNKEDNTSEIVIRSNVYHVKGIDYEHQNATLVHKDYFLHDSCHSPRDSTRIDFRFFNFTLGDARLLVLENCPDYHPHGLSYIKNSHFRFLECLSNRKESLHAYMNVQSIRGLESPIDDDEQIEIERIPIPPQLQNCPNKTLLYIQDEFDIAERLLDNFGQEMSQGFQVTWSQIDPSKHCWRCNQSHPHCFYNAEDPRQPVCVPSAADSGKRKALKYIIGAVLASGTISLACIAIFLSKHRRKWITCDNQSVENPSIETFLKNYGSLVPRRYSYSKLKKITSSFKDELGQGGFGRVFKGRLADGRLVAVKVLNISKGHNGEEFVNEVASIGRTHHINVVALLGFCSEGSKRALVYEFVLNGSLDKFIYSRKSRTPILNVEKLFKIAIGIARGLEYLHRGCNTRILHFDIKPHNILLDENCCPKIADFGLAKLCPGQASTISMTDARGTMGYTAPEVFSRSIGGVSHKSDVYSYGMVILEMIGGRKNVDANVEKTSEIYFPHWIYKHIALEENLELLEFVAKGEEEIAKKMILVGLWCIQTNPTSRPSMSEVLEMLQTSVGSLQMPPKPYLSSP